jgi:lipoprotein NlpI
MQERGRDLALGVVVVMVVAGLGTVRTVWGQPAAQPAPQQQPDPAVVTHDQGVRFAQEGKWREAVTAFNKAIELSPNFAAAYASRAHVYHMLGQHQQGIADYSQAISRQVGYVQAYYNRGNVYSDSGQYQRALADYSEALRLNPRYTDAYYNRGLVYLYLGQGDAGADARAYLSLKGWQETQSQYIVMIGYFGYRQIGRSDEAQQMLDEAASKCNTAVWPYPILRYLRREITAQALFDAANDRDKQTEALTYVGLDVSRSGHREHALSYLQWVQTNGNKQFVEYVMAMTELHRLQYAAASPAHAPAPVQQARPLAPVQTQPQAQAQPAPASNSGVRGWLPF